jgi:hypothetical protein
MMRKVGGVLAGIATFVIVLMTIEYIAHQVFNTSPGDPVPNGMHAFIALAYFIAAFAGGYVAARIAAERWAAWLIAVVVAAGAAYAIGTMPQPLWMQIASIVAPLLGGLAASRLAMPGSRVAADAGA